MIPDERFRKSSYSGHSQNCVEAASVSEVSAIRDSKHPEHGHLSFPSSEWHAFLQATQRGAL
ncbi:DUF397 domain-containing protein [Nocardiopsis suaedae]|uniref:DUF397 domain-containing protein n=1 Tax=Nocardiopsis suaedae TaxID=3018444 RepID=A0ABT4TQJ2_9ACTN|nr:DUF397 domain-containing protein [Nocardiopsis suaedae]MDA2806630.1 DUF397 domain-containing protein [Nocardiopsis suaedae]